MEARASERNANLNAVTRGGTRTGPDAVEEHLVKFGRLVLEYLSSMPPSRKTFSEKLNVPKHVCTCYSESCDDQGYSSNLLDILRAAEGYLQAATE
ncbi:hypothetical protein Droror1_Dr00028260, partial [Drosera rotundifolia]